MGLGGGGGTIYIYIYVIVNAFDLKCGMYMCVIYIDIYNYIHL